MLVIVGIVIGSEVHAHAARGVLNLHSAGHYQTDEALYGSFTRKTWIRINRIALVRAKDVGAEDSRPRRLPIT